MWCTLESSRRSCVWRLPSCLLLKSYMYIRLISAPEASRCPLESVDACVPARMIDLPWQALHPRVPVPVSAVRAAVPRLLLELSKALWQLHLWTQSQCASLCSSGCFLARGIPVFKYPFVFFQMPGPGFEHFSLRLSRALEGIGADSSWLAFPGCFLHVLFPLWPPGSQGLLEGNRCLLKWTSDPACTAIIQHLLRSWCSLKLCKRTRESFTYPIG